MSEPKPPQPPIKDPYGEILPFSQKAQEVKNKLISLVLGLTKDKREEINAEIASHVEYLRSKYSASECNSCELYHVLASSSLSSNLPEITVHDFPGQDSIASFINDLTVKYKPEELSFSPKNQILRDRIIKLTLSLSMKKKGELYLKRVAQAKYLRDKYSDWKKRESYWVVAGGTLEPSLGKDFYSVEDFPNDDSVEKFIENLEAEYSI